MSDVATGSRGALTLTLTTVDVPRAARFWDAALAPAGLDRVAELVDEEEDDASVEAVAWDSAGGPGLVWLVSGPASTSHVHVRLRAADRAAVEAFHAAALAAGGTNHTSPRRWPIYRRGEFAAAVHDLDGNVLEVVAGE